VFADKHVAIVNDSCATSPDGVAAVLARFGHDPKHKLILITGGTDKQLHYDDLARTLKSTLPKDQIIFLEGTGTTKLIAALRRVKYLKDDPVQYKTLEECVRMAWEQTLNLPKGKKAVVVFSPGGSSFEKFLHEFARGAAFNDLVKKFWK
jgi:UDP-N-acetylmuramoylalanine-D-glutamate ligase